MLVVTPTCAAGAVVSAVVLRRPTKQYTHRYSMMHRRLTTAGIEVATHYHQLPPSVISLDEKIKYYGAGFQFSCLVHDKHRVNK